MDEEEEEEKVPAPLSLELRSESLRRSWSRSEVTERARRRVKEVVPESGVPESDRESDVEPSRCRTSRSHSRCVDIELTACN